MGEDGPSQRNCYHHLQCARSDIRTQRPARDRVAKMKSEINYHEQSHYYSTKFMRNSKAVGVLWGIFTVCYTVLIIVVFLQDQWIGDAENSKGPGNFGIWRWCVDSQDGTEICRGRLDDFGTILSPAFHGAQQVPLQDATGAVQPRPA